MIAGTHRRPSAVGEARGVGDVGGRIGMPGQTELPAEVKRVALIVVEEAATAAERKIGEAAVDATTTEGELIWVGQVDLAAVMDARRAQRKFPAVDARALNGDRDENLRVIEIVVVEEVGGASEKVVSVQDPAFEGNRDSELMLFVPLAMQGHEIKPLLGLDVI